MQGKKKLKKLVVYRRPCSRQQQTLTKQKNCRKKKPVGFEVERAAAQKIEARALVGKGLRAAVVVHRKPCTLLRKQHLQKKKIRQSAERHRECCTLPPKEPYEK
jgi:hypothetical protein